nr:MAG: replication associated protein [Cressdnaviricota sp.]
MNIPHESKYWHFRINDTSDEQFELLKNLECEFIVIGAVEIGDVAKGRHYHCAIKFDRSYGKISVLRKVLYNKKLMDDVHWHLSPKYKNSTQDQFIKYVIKNGKDFMKGIEFIEEEGDLEEGELPAPPVSKGEQKAKEKFELSIIRKEKAAIGDIEWFRENDFRYMASAEFNRLLVWAQPDETKCLDKLDNYFIYGNSGTGKSSSIEFLYPGCYRKIKNNEKWDSYFNLNEKHKTVYFDELDDMDAIDKCCGGYEGLKTMAEVYPFAVRQNYGNRQLMIRPERIIITSNYTPSQIFSTPNKYGRQPAHLDMLLRTFHRKFKVMSISDWQLMNGIQFNNETQRTELAWDN